MKSLLSTFFLCFFLFFILGCGEKQERTMINLPSPDSSVKITENFRQEETSLPDIPENTTPQGMTASPLTNEWVSLETASLRPLAVMIPNDASALPHYNLSKADILYEVPVEGNMTRLMGIFGDWTTLERVGNIRSCRDYFVYWAFEWDAIYIHAGGPFYIHDVISRSDTQNIDALSAPEGVFYRTTDRSAPQNLYFDGSSLLKEAGRLSYPLEIREGYRDNLHFQFSREENRLDQYSQASFAKKIYLKNAYPVTGTWFEYNEDDGLYYRFQSISNGAHMDAATGKQLAFKNIILQFTYSEVRDSQGYLAFQCIDSSRDGWYFTNGKAIHINWRKDSDYGSTRYYDDNGNEILLNTGKTMICILRDGSTFSFANK